MTVATARDTTGGKRERQREATYDEIVRAARALLAEGADPSLRAVATRMGVTAPALYRYVASHQELVDLVAFEIDKTATELFRAAGDRYPDDDPAAQLVAAATAFRTWALANPREFSLVFANPVADTACVRREMLTSATSGHYMNGLLVAVWHTYDVPVPPVDELDEAVRDAVVEPLVPIDLALVPVADRPILWLFMRAWAALYGTVTLEVFGHMDPRIIESGAMFVDMIRQWIPRLGLDAEYDRLDAILRAEVVRPLTTPPDA